MAYGAGQANTVRPNTISIAIEDFDSALDRAASYADRLQKLNDRINGPRPTELVDKPPNLAGVPHSVIGSIHERRSRLVGILDGFERALDGLEGGI